MPGTKLAELAVVLILWWNAGLSWSLLGFIVLGGFMLNMVLALVRGLN